MTVWTILDYVELTGRNPIADWLEAQPVAAQAIIAARLAKMESLAKWSDKWASKLTGYEGIIELRIKANKVQYRPLGMYLPGHLYVILCGAIEKGDKIEQRHLDTAVRRRRHVQDDEANHVRPHSY